MVIRTKAISAENTFTDPIILTQSQGEQKFTFLNVSIYGTFEATVTIQRSFDEGTTWEPVKSFTAPTGQTIEELGQPQYRIGIKTGDYSSGTVNVRIALE